MAQGTEPSTKGDTSIAAALHHRGHEQDVNIAEGPQASGFKVCRRKGPRHHTSLFVILTSGRERGQLDQKRLMLLPDPLTFKLLTMFIVKVPFPPGSGKSRQQHCTD